MKSLSFEAAYALLKSTLPGGRDFVRERVENLGADGSDVVDLVSYYEPRLTTCLRTIGGWTFIVQNRFLSEHVQRLALVWHWHRGGMRIDEAALQEALSHCFRHFYAEIALAEDGNSLAGEVALLGRILFERELIQPILEEASDNMTLALPARDIERTAQAIGKYHEIGHYAFNHPGVSVADASAVLLDGLVLESLDRAMRDGRPDLAEELFCDALALQVVADGPIGPLSHHPVATRVRMGLFAFYAYLYLSILGFDARAAARSDRGPYLSAASPRRSALADRIFLIAKISDELCRRKGVDLMGEDDILPRIDRLGELMLNAYRDHHRLPSRPKRPLRA